MFARRLITFVINGISLVVRIHFDSIPFLQMCFETCWCWVLTLTYLKLLTRFAWKRRLPHSFDWVINFDFGSYPACITATLIMKLCDYWIVSSFFNLNFSTTVSLKCITDMQFFDLPLATTRQPSAALSCFIASNSRACITGLV